MKQSYENVQETRPSVHVTTNKSRRKIYNKPDSFSPIYYLKDGEEFELELYNPTQSIIMASISLNNRTLDGGGLVLKPGQRVFLDRYLNSPRKFKFETYEVGTTESDKKAIKNNGNLEVGFYREQLYIPKLTSTHSVYYSNSNLTTTNVNYSSTNTGSGIIGNTFMPTTLTTSTFDSPLRSETTIETGRVEQGGHSDQEFTNVHYEFDHLPFHTELFELLPYSTKVKTVNDIKVVRYCTECGAKTKPTFKFCAQCGNKI